MLAGEPNSLLGTAGFSRHGLEFVRVLDGVSQHVGFSIAIKPAHAPDDAQLVAHVDLQVPEAEVVYQAMMLSAGDIAQGGPMRTPTDSLKDRPGGIWLFRHEAAAMGLARPVARAMTDYVLPYCESTRDLDSILGRCKVETENALDLATVLGLSHDLGGPRAVFGAAIATVLGRHDEAAELLELAYPEGSPSRMRYSSAFEFVRDRREG